MKIEYESEGIHLPDTQKHTLHMLQGLIMTHESTFSRNATNDNQLFELNGIPRHSVSFIRDWLKASVPQPMDTHSDTVVCSSNRRVSLPLLKSLQSEKNREHLWYQIWAEPHDNIKQLGSLIQYRHQLAQLLGYPSYAHKFLSRQAVKTPELVTAHLVLLSDRIRPKAESECNTLTKLKRTLDGQTGPSRPWDISYLSGVHAALQKEFVKEPTYGFSERAQQQSLSEYFPLTRCIEGLATLCHQLFGMRFVQCPISHQEQWAAFNSSSSSSRSSSGGMYRFLPFLKSTTSSNTTSGDASSDAKFSIETGLYKFEVYADDSKNNSCGSSGSSSSSSSSNKNTTDNNSNSKNNSSSSSRDEVLIGVLYLDVYVRPGKFTGSAMFTVQSGCRPSVDFGDGEKSVYESVYRNISIY